MHPVAGQEGHRPRMICEYPEGYALGFCGSVGLFHNLGNPVEEGAKEIGVIVGVNPLHDRSQPLQTQPGVDARRRQGRSLSAGVAVELHEDQIPELQKLSARAGGLELQGVGRAGAVGGGAQIVVQLGAGTAGASVGHLPEVVAVAQGVNPLRRDPGDLDPEPRRLRVGVMHGDKEAVRIESHVGGQESPGVLHGLALEVVAEGEVAEHLEEGVVAGRTPHLLEVVVLAPGAHTFLRGRRAGKG